MSTNKQEWLDEATEYVDNMNSQEFEEFIESCISDNLDSDDINQALEMAL